METKVRLPTWVEQYGAFIALLVIGALIGIALYNGIKENGVWTLSKETRLKGDAFCKNHEYDSLGSMVNIMGTYYKITCERIANYSFEMKEFDVYTDELLTIYEWNAKVATNGNQMAIIQVQATGR